MPDTRTGLRPGPSPRTVRDDSGVLAVPAGWEHLPPGDAAVTRAVKALGPTWGVEEPRGRKVYSRGVWAPAENIAKARAAVEAQREDPAHQRKLEASRRRREKEQEEYVREFEASVLDFLRFHPRHAQLAADLAARVTAHATPVGSGTVARTERIPVERRAQAAVIAWMRHQTTAYDDMVIPRVKGARREVRRQLAERSRAVLQRYRRGEEPDAACPLARALATAPASQSTAAPVPACSSAALSRSPIASARSPAASPRSPAASPPSPVASSRSAAASPSPAASPPSPAASPPSRSASPPSRSASPPSPTASPRSPTASPKAPTASPPSPAGSSRSLTPPRPPAAPSPPVPPGDDRFAPRTAHEEAQRALYEKVRARLLRGR
jgi:hypothetical protein